MASLFSCPALRCLFEPQYTPPFAAHANHLEGSISSTAVVEDEVLCPLGWWWLKAWNMQNGLMQTLLQH